MIKFNLETHVYILAPVFTGVDPSLCDKQRQLRRAKIADSLSNQVTFSNTKLFNTFWINQKMFF